MSENYMLEPKDQFQNFSDYTILPTPENKFLKCRSCDIEFYTKASVSFNGRLVKSKKNDDESFILCPVCSSCFARFFPSELIFEKIRKPLIPHSFVTIRSKKAYDYKEIARTAYMIALLDLNVEEYSYVRFKDINKTIKISEFVEKLKVLSVTYHRMMDLLLNETYFNEELSEDFIEHGEGHFHLGEIISISVRDQKNIPPELLDKIGVYPSVKYIVELVENHIFNIKEIANIVGIELEN